MKAPPEPGPVFRSGLLPMVDVAFLLLIAFLGSLRFIGLEEKVAVQLPRDRGFSCSLGVHPVAPPRLDVLLHPFTRGEPSRVYLAGMYLGTGRRGIAELRRLARALAAGDERPVGSLEAAADVPHREVIAAMDALWSSGVTAIDLVGPPPFRGPRR